jgi:hypothetical protein
MKKFLGLILAFLIIYSCGPKQEEVEKYMEDGVEVIVNHLEPYKIKGDPSILHLEEEFTIDSEYFHIARIGLTDILCFDVDSKGNIYFLKSKQRNENNIFKFDRNGRFITSFCPKGQGPGEIKYASWMDIDNQDNIVVTDMSKFKLIIFNQDGGLTRETSIEVGTMAVPCTDDGKFLIFGQDIDSMRREYEHLPLKLVNSRLETIKELDRYKKSENDAKTKRYRGTGILFCWSVSKGSIYIGNEKRGYEIWKYDLEGNLIQKIKKEYEKAPIPEEYKKETIERLPEMLKKRTYFPDFFPPYQAFFNDDRGRLFVVTYEEGENPSEFMVDIFNHDGVFVGRKSLDIRTWNGLLWAKMIGNLFYCPQENESGYKKLIVYKMRWE